MSSWKINPATGDYIVVNGKPVSSDSLIYPAYYRAIVPRGSWLHAPNDNYGSSLSGVNRKLPSRDIRGISSSIQKALQPMIDDGRAIDVDVQLVNGETNRNNVQVGVNITDISGRTDTLNLPPIGV